MGWFSKIFRSSEITSKSRDQILAEQLYKDLKEDKDRLLEENRQLRAEIVTLNKQIFDYISNSKENDKNTYNNEKNTYNNDINTSKIVYEVKKPVNKNLSPKENEIYELYLQHKGYNETLHASKMKEPSFMVYISRLRKKGKDIKWN